jgi:hypothetical protein
MSLGRGGGAGGPMKFFFSFEENFDFRPKNDIFFRTCLGPLVIFTNLKKTFQKKFDGPGSW